jgi:hypothetical protein
LEQILHSRWQQPHPRGHDRERITRARQAAEALFTPKRQVTEQSVANSPAIDHSARKPRVLEISPPAPVPPKPVKSQLSPAPPAMRAVPRSHFARIRTWVKYGMTVLQVAEVYGVDVGEIERILRRA